ncbi:MAG: PAS domain S-box protein [Candidatus Obscuribacterales bacterium]|nr:PAS domain S-box protein [Candidatus Obscuribacterales bacterium]
MHDDGLTNIELLKKVRQQAESLENLTQALAVRQQRVRQILTSIPLGLIVMQANHIIGINSRAEKLFNYKPEELVGKHISILFPDFDVSADEQRDVKLMGRRKSGETFAAEVNSNEVDMGDLVRVFVHVQDITERQRLEQLKSDLLAMVSHDMRTPLTTVRLFLTLLSDGAYGHLEGKGEAGLTRAQSCVEYLISLVSALLDSEKIESGSIELDIAETTSGAIVEKAILNSHGAAIGKDIQLIRRVNNVNLFADEDRLVQVLMNLISNAIKFSPNDSQVTVASQREQTGEVVFQVIDRGPGIPEHLKTAVFERYRQLKQSNKTKAQGFGLGLAICKALVQMHGGTIWVDSKEGEGTTFSFSIPMTANQRT